MAATGRGWGVDEHEERSEATDPASRMRDHLANERTFLAWLRTGATIMVLGLAVARLLEPGDRSALAAGVVLVVAGAALLVQGALRFRHMHRELAAGRFGAEEAARGPLVAAVVLMLAVAGALVLLLV